jgi:hypothetical protein
METPIERLRRAPSLVTEPLEAHLSNNNSDHQARPLRNMPLFPRTRFGRIQQGRSAFVGHEENVAEPDIMLTPTSTEDCEQTQGIQQTKNIYSLEILILLCEKEDIGSSSVTSSLLVGSLPQHLPPSAAASSRSDEQREYEEIKKDWQEAYDDVTYDRGM